jgi:hypothetical protein
MDVMVDLAHPLTDRSVQIGQGCPYVFGEVADHALVHDVHGGFDRALSRGLLTLVETTAVPWWSASSW